jgi:hypothetical protein
MRITLEVNALSDNGIKGTAQSLDSGDPVAFNGWLELMRVIEDAQGPPAHADTA